MPSGKEKFASLNGTISLFRSNLPFILFWTLFFLRHTPYGAYFVEPFLRGLGLMRGLNGDRDFLKKRCLVKTLAEPLEIHFISQVV